MTISEVTAVVNMLTTIESFLVKSKEMFPELTAKIDALLAKIAAAVSKLSGKTVEQSTHEWYNRVNMEEKAMSFSKIKEFLAFLVSRKKVAADVAEKLEALINKEAASLDDVNTKIDAIGAVLKALLDKIEALDTTAASSPPPTENSTTLT